MTKTEQNIANLYETLISDGYFRDDNGDINMSVEQFGENHDIEQQGIFFVVLRVIRLGWQKVMVKPHGSLVSVSSMRCRTSTPDLSTLSSSTSLQVACATGYLILEWASRLDAFSGYPFRT